MRHILRKKEGMGLTTCLLALLLFLLVTPCTGSPPKGPPEGLYARVETTRGTLTFSLFFHEAPLTVANFVGLSEGRIPWKDPRSGQIQEKPFYDELPFHRLIPGFAILAGDPKGNGRGGPGYVFERECNPALRHEGPGVLSMLNRGDFSHGSQFLITLEAAPALDGRHAVFGKIVQGMDVLRKLGVEDKILRVRVLRIGATAQRYDLAPQLVRLKSSAEQASRSLREDTRRRAARPDRQDCSRTIPSFSGEEDPRALPRQDQPFARAIALEYILVTYRGALTPRHTQCYEKSEALEAARALSRLARIRGQDFSRLALRYSDSVDFRIPLLRSSKVTNGPFRSLFRLKEGQISKPMETPQGYMVFKRVPLETIRVRHILVTFRGARGLSADRTRQEARSLAERILRRAREGEDFSELARTYSDSSSAAQGGLLPPLARGMALPSFEIAAFALRPHEISGVVPTPHGFQIIQRVE